MASELVDKLKETLQPQEHTAFQGEGRASDEQPQRSTRSENTQSFSGQTYDENPSRNENVSFNTNTFESSRNTNLETPQNEDDKPRRYSGQQYKSLLGDINTAMPRNAERHKEESTREKADFDPRDAAHAPPSVFAKHVGQPSIEHKFASDSHTRRHSITSLQEQHYHIGQDH